ncbi:hypothetical protein EVAR_41007_1 [Eumeta japonica]|uniref:Uncharacterized protein n=1 Tax=Eumeta variegata TaxID=151549 RepID=A0A4C1XI81_EUMVA|nr:hypothetical protein EVAR_41007_1 [Eumeta japonica]
MAIIRQAESVLIVRRAGGRLVSYEVTSGKDSVVEKIGVTSKLTGFDPEDGRNGKIKSLITRLADGSYTGKSVRPTLLKQKHEREKEGICYCLPFPTHYRPWSSRGRVVIASNKEILSPTTYELTADRFSTQITPLAQYLGDHWRELNRRTIPNVSALKITVVNLDPPTTDNNCVTRDKSPSRRPRASGARSSHAICHGIHFARPNDPTSRAEVPNLGVGVKSVFLRCHRITILKRLGATALRFAHVHDPPSAQASMHRRVFVIARMLAAYVQNYKTSSTEHQRCAHVAACTLHDAWFPACGAAFHTPGYIE